MKLSLVTKEYHGITWTIHRWQQRYRYHCRKTGLARDNRTPINRKGYWVDASVYQYGLLAPHYPVPAIAYELEYGWTTLVLWQRASDCTICHDYWELD